MRATADDGGRLRKEQRGCVNIAAHQPATACNLLNATTLSLWRSAVKHLCQTLLTSAADAIERKGFVPQGSIPTVGRMLRSFTPVFMSGRPIFLGIMTFNRSDWHNRYGPGYDPGVTTESPRRGQSPRCLGTSRRSPAPEVVRPPIFIIFP